MQREFKKIIERLEEREVQAYAKTDDGATYTAYRNAIEIVDQVAEEYKQKCRDRSPDKPDNPPCDRVAEEYGGGWIPVSSGKLPEESGTYLTWVRYNGEEFYALDEIDCDGVLKEWNCISGYEILAWKPIEPYKSESEG